jgi:hypothetical protein
VSTTTLEQRVGVLEAASGGDGGCERCRGLLVTVTNVITDEFNSATWNGEAISEEDLLERRTEARCPSCGRKIDQDGIPIIKVGGHR